MFFTEEVILSNINCDLAKLIHLLNNHATRCHHLLANWPILHTAYIARENDSLLLGK